MPTNPQQEEVMTHTPTPWHRNVSPAYKYPIYADKNGNPDGKDWIHIAAVLQSNSNAEMDLDFIIQAVNAYKRDQEALRAAYDELKYGGNHEAINLVEQAIAKAEGK